MNLTAIATAATAGVAVLGAATYAFISQKKTEAEISLVEGMINGFQLPTGLDNLTETEVKIKVEDVTHCIKVREVHDNEDVVSMRVKPTIVPMHIFEEDLSAPFEIGDEPVEVEFARAIHRVKSLVSQDAPLLELLLRASQQTVLHSEMMTSEIMLDHCPTDEHSLGYVLSKSVDSLEGVTKQIYEIGLIIEGKQFSVEVLQDQLTKEFSAVPTADSTGNWDELLLLLDTPFLIDEAEVIETTNSMFEALTFKTKGVTGNVRVHDSDCRRARLVKLMVPMGVFEETLGYNDQGKLCRKLLEV